MTNEEYINMIGRTDLFRSSWAAPIFTMQQAPVTPFTQYQSGLMQSTTSPQLTDLYKQVLGMSPTLTSKSVSSQFSRQNRSPELEATMNQFTQMLNSLSSQTTQAYQGKQNTYADLIKSLSDMFGARGSAAASSTQASALSSGLTPLEASSAGNNTLLANLQQFFPALAGLRGEAADVGIQNQAALQSIQQQLNLPFISQVLSPYQQNVAGQSVTGSETSTQTNPLAKMQLLGQLASALETSRLQQETTQKNDALGWAQLQALINQNQAENQLGYSQVGQRQQEAQMQNALGMGQLGVQQGGLMAELMQLAQQGSQFDTSQQNAITKAQGDWANQLAQIVMQGQNAVGTQWANAEAQNWLNNQGVPDTGDIEY